MTKVLVALSGGIDSSFSAYLLKKQGYKVTGITFNLWDISEKDENRHSLCCGLEAVASARRVCERLGIKHYVIDIKKLFERTVVQNFINGYISGTTPNPCVICNERIKFKSLLDIAKSLKIQFIATGHYARVGYNKRLKRFILRKAIDEQKDQSYFLYRLSQEQLASTILPLGDWKKEDIIKKAEKIKILRYIRPESQELCFISGKSYVEFIRQYVKKDCPSGKIIDTNGNVIGTHKGIISYTIGQRKGLGISKSNPLYVIKIDKKNNQIIVGNKEALFSKYVYVKDLNWIIPIKKDNIEIKAKIRYRNKEKPIKLKKLNNKLIAEFKTPVRAVTPGQSIVFYKNDDVIGGGIISYYSN